jgi:hypothetical protein
MSHRIEGKDFNRLSSFYSIANPAAQEIFPTKHLFVSVPKKDRGTKMFPSAKLTFVSEFVKTGNRGQALTVLDH